ncbi:TraR/DksA family transcriptional regulator [Piscinibacter sp. XHJ-5]|uniref:TraR/DksA family transcriptional regulator n=1 Tax=Piscinibacter sp. XHJ-5 TaxID=3037797 RepID=UPI00245321BD|nr:TraR/DksA family transcriptional regulator [Piscinibacter sp. XHJ-5]
MSHLSPAQLQSIEERLSTRETELQERVRSAKESAAERPSAQGPQVEDIAEEGEQRYRHGMEHVELIRDQEELAEIADARTRIGDGRYGECIDCGMPISFERLSAQPTAKRCIADQEAWEKKHGTTLRYSA